MKYDQQHDGDLITPVMKGYRIMCCDCRLVHVIDFFVVRRGRGHKRKDYIRFRVRRDGRATAAARRK